MAVRGCCRDHQADEAVMDDMPPMRPWPARMYFQVRMGGLSWTRFLFVLVIPANGMTHCWRPSACMAGHESVWLSVSVGG
eukprot:32612-Eustigmatos_ZCMA.PRE.1